MKKTISFIGGGRITKIFLNAFKNSDISFEKVLVFDPGAEALNSLKSIYTNFIAVESPEAACKADVLVLAVHPPVFGEILPKLAGEVSRETLVLSLAPKITLEKISTALSIKNVARMIPNATSFTSHGYNPISFYPEMEESTKSAYLELFSALGDNFETEEKKLEGYAIVSAMLPTYFWFQWQEMEKIALETGFSESEAKEVVGNTLKEALQIFYHSELDHEQVIDLIPVKPIGENEEEIKTILNTKLLGLYNKIKP